MKFIDIFKPFRCEETIPSKKELFKARFSAGFVLSESAEEYDSKLLQIPIDRIYLYKEKYNSIKLFEKDHPLYSREVFAFKEKVCNDLINPSEFDLYSSYLQDRGIKSIILFDAHKLNFSVSKIAKYESYFNSLIHFVELFGPCSRKSRECYISIIENIDNINDWQKFYSYKLTNKSLKETRQLYANQMMKYAQKEPVLHTKIGGVRADKYKPVKEYYKDSIVTCFSKESLSIIIYKKDITELVSGSIAYGYLDVFYYKQYGVIFIVFKFLDNYKFTYYFNIKSNEQKAREWINGDSDKVEIWLVDRVAYELKAWTRFELNAISSIKQCLRIVQKPNTYKEIEETAKGLQKEYDSDDIVKLSVGSERVFSDS